MLRLAKQSKYHISATVQSEFQYNSQPTQQQQQQPGEEKVPSQFRVVILKTNHKQSKNTLFINF